MIIFQNNKKFSEYRFQKEEEFEEVLKSNCKNFFGNNIIYIDSKKKIEAKALGGVIPDGILIDFSDKDNPEFYLVEIELSKHSFFSHIFPQITKFFAFFNNSKSRNELIEKVFSVINNDEGLRDEFRKYLLKKEIYKFLKDIIEKSQNILLVIDGEKFEMPEIMETYYDTWGKTVKIITIKKFNNKDEDIYTVEPEFENIEEEYIPKDDPVDEYPENYHLDYVVNEDVKEAYSLLKDAI